MACLPQLNCVYWCPLKKEGYTSPLRGYVYFAVKVPLAVVLV